MMNLGVKFALRISPAFIIRLKGGREAEGRDAFAASMAALIEALKGWPSAVVLALSRESTTDMTAGTRDVSSDHSSRRTRASGGSPERKPRSVEKEDADVGIHPGSHMAFRGTRGSSFGKLAQSTSEAW
eukprot:CAMPEP_0182462256 /NCGR_PEP_ID=MMETSP1319-20130603/6588_1 /TAXON_ID=172717 /ORGANISM="Bolidomonas pacifica, Strain RCC208" /LENGTH=128 /DNA_ID=CAMNT_0024661665 /DNA_START=220 /DNA_END=603 /DNA_ORIENTATION=+